MDSKTKAKLEERAHELRAQGRTTRSAFFQLRREFRWVEKGQIYAALGAIGRESGLWSQANISFAFETHYPSRELDPKDVDGGVDFGPWGDGS